MNDEQQGPTSVALLQGGAYVKEVSVKTEMSTLLSGAICKISESKYSYNDTEVSMYDNRVKWSSQMSKCKGITNIKTTTLFHENRTKKAKNYL